MCYGVIKQARIKNIYYAISASKKEGYTYYIKNDETHSVTIIEDERPKELMANFFQKMRAKK
jgi:tRNA(Arg) A34 adenosine deaminase TadA